MEIYSVLVVWKIILYFTKDGQYMRTLKPAGVDGNYTVELLHLSYQGHVIFTGSVRNRRRSSLFLLSERRNRGSTRYQRQNPLLLT